MRSGPADFLGALDEGFGELLRAQKAAQEKMAGLGRARPDPYASRPADLVVAGGLAEAGYWAGLLRVEPAWTIFVLPGVSESVVLGRRFREAWFVGTWGRMDAGFCERLHDRLDLLRVPRTFVCSPAGEMLERRVLWTRWSAPSTGKTTRAHVFGQVDEGFDLDAAEYVALCGHRLSRAELTRSQVLDREERYGAPPTACGVCAHAARKFPVEGPSPDDPIVRHAVRVLAMRRRIQAANKISGCGPPE